VDELKAHVRRLKAELQHVPTASKLEPLGADADTLDSLNVSGAIKDELHAWKDRALWDVIDTATGARSQPLGLSTTTAGWNRRSIWWERRELCLKMLEGVEGYDNDELFALVYTLDDGDDHEDPRNWIKANPSLGVIVQEQELAKRLKEAKQSGKLFAFLRLRLNKPTDTAARWLDMDRWRKCADPVDEQTLYGRACYGGLDLSQTTDLTGWALWFPPVPGDPLWRLIVRHWLPREDLGAREARDKVPYGKWADGSRLTLCEGIWVDYAMIRERVLLDARNFRLMGVAYDNRFAPSLVQNLITEGVECHPWNQNVSGMNTATKEFRRFVLAREMSHQGCPLLEWEAENTAIKETSEGYVKPNKAGSSQRIDGIAAAISALGLAIHKNGAGPVMAGIGEIDLDFDFGGLF
jgi:phage terminase large subunit-like protein